MVSLAENATFYICSWCKGAKVLEAKSQKKLFAVLLAMFLTTPMYCHLKNNIHVA